MKNSALCLLTKNPLLRPNKNWQAHYIRHHKYKSTLAPVTYNAKNKPLVKLSLLTSGVSKGFAFGGLLVPLLPRAKEHKITLFHSGDVLEQTRHSITDATSRCRNCPPVLPAGCRLSLLKSLKVRS